jgi:hypothetical protein
MAVNFIGGGNLSTLRKPPAHDICIYVYGAKPFYFLCRPYYDAMFYDVSVVYGSFIL